MPPALLFFSGRAIEGKDPGWVSSRSLLVPLGRCQI